MAKLVNIGKCSKSALETHLRTFDSYIFDIEGVIMKAGKVLPGAKEMIQRLQQHANVYVFTNSSSDRDAWIKKLSWGGVVIPRSHLFTAGFVASCYLKAQAVKSAYAIGGAGLLKELSEAEIQAIPSIDANGKSAESLIETGNADSIVIGFDPYFNSYKMSMAGYFLRNPKCLLVGTNPEARFVNLGVVLPAAGTLMKAVEVFSQRAANMVAGKPNPYILGLLKRQFPSFDPYTTCMVGDRLDTDMEFAHRTGMTGLLLYSGETSVVQAQAATVAKQPKFAAQGLDALHSVLSQ